MGNIKDNYLHFAKFSDLVNWSVSHLMRMNMGFTHRFPMVTIGSVIERCKVTIDIDDSTQYKQITLKTNGGGAVLRDVKFGKDIGTKKQYVVSTGQFIMSKIDARNGAFGVVTEDLDGAIVTADFPVFIVNKEKIIPQYLFLLSSTKAFSRFAQSCSRGTTNRQRIDIKQFLSQRIPLPSITEQKRLLTSYFTKIHQTEILTKQACFIENEIESYLLNCLGISLQDKTQNDKTAEFHFLKFVRYKGIGRWDCFNGESNVFTELRKSPYYVTEIWKAYNFTKRNWNKKEKTFRYVEIGSVDSMNGIVKAEEISTSKAPSRATQIIKTGDLILGTTRPYLKKFAIVDSTYNNCVCSSGFQVIAPNKKNNSSFLCEYLKTSAAVKQFEHFMTGALYPAITNKDLMKILIPLPPIEIQNTIVEHISEQKTKIKQLKQQAETLRKAALIEFEKEIFE